MLMKEAALHWMRKMKMKKCGNLDQWEMSGVGQHEGEGRKSQHVMVIGKVVKVAALTSS